MSDCRSTLTRGARLDGSHRGRFYGLSAGCALDVPAVASLFVVVRRNPERAASQPVYPWAPAAFVTFTFVSAGRAATVNSWEMLAAVVTIASGARGLNLAVIDVKLLAGETVR